MKRAQRRKFHYIYKITNKLNGKFYIGMHSTDNLDDGYFGSGKYLWNSINKHGKENHEMEILEHYFSREDLAAREKELVNRELIGTALCMNLKVGGDGGFPRPTNGKFWNDHHSKTFHSAGAKAVNKIRSDRFNKKLEDDDFKSEWIHKCCQTKFEKTGSRNGWKGKHQSEMHKQKIGERNSLLQSGNGNSQFGTCWINDGSVVKKIKNDELQSWLEKGWLKGRKIT